MNLAGTVIVLVVAAAGTAGKTPTSKPKHIETGAGSVEKGATPLARIDGGFVDWSKAWKIDRYVPSSVRISAQRTQGDLNEVIGTFSFVRGDQPMTFQFGALLRRNGRNLELAKLCYSGGMERDCYAPRPSGSKVAPSPAASVAVLSPIEAAFKDWGGTWAFDRYILQSARVVQQQTAGPLVDVLGTFSFQRGGQPLIYPFTASLQRDGDRFAVTKLCYDNGALERACYGSLPWWVALVDDSSDADEGDDADTDRRTRDHDHQRAADMERDRDDKKRREYEQEQQARADERQRQETARWYQKREDEERARAINRQKPGVQ